MDSLVGSLLLLAAWPSIVAALDLSICASFNTASMQKNLSIYQTNGLCHDYCIEKNQAYAITQGNGCWCSDFTPAKSKQVGTDKCNTDCPGYPDDKCGGPGLFGYIALNKVLPSGTKGDDPPPPPSSSSSAQPKTEITTETAFVIKTVQDAASSSTFTTSTSTTSSSSSRSTESSTESPTPTVSAIQTVTAGGTIQTVTIVPTPTSAAMHQPTDDAAARGRQGGGLGTGGVVGVVVGVIACILGAAGVGLLLYFRHRKRRDYQDDPSVRGSSSGIMGRRPEMAGAPGSPGSAGNRSSTLQIDPRMDPFKQGLYARSGSHESVNTLRDDHDYSRRIQQPKVLRATNPDPADDD